MSLDIPGKVVVGIPFVLQSAQTKDNGSFVLTYAAGNGDDEEDPLKFEIEIVRGPQGFGEKVVERALVQVAAAHLVPKVVAYTNLTKPIPDSTTGEVTTEEEIAARMEQRALWQETSVGKLLATLATKLDSDLSLVIDALSGREDLAELKDSDLATRLEELRGHADNELSRLEDALAEVPRA